MLGQLPTYLLMAALCASVPASPDQAPPPDWLQWGQLAPLPDRVGVAGPFAGITGNALLVVGGANFPDRAPWEGGARAWSDRIFVLTSPGGAWRELDERLPRARAYGVALSGPEGLYCLGGADAEAHYTEAFILRWTGERLEREALPPLPAPCAYACGAILGDTLYVAGGRSTPSSTGTLRTFWALPLGKTGPRDWQELPAWPGRPRMLAVAAVQDGQFFLCSGVDLVEGPDGAPLREYLSDVWSYRPGVGWQAAASVPQPVAAAPSPAPSVGQFHFLVLGGDDGALAPRVAELREQHPGFSDRVLAYHTITDTWTELGRIPRDPGGIRPPVTIPACRWGELTILPSGEVRPALRSPQIATLAFRPLARSGLGRLDLAAMILYLAGLLVIAWICMKRQTSTADFFLAGKRIPAWAAGLSIFGTQLSAITFMAIPAKAYTSDWVFFLNNMTIVLLAPLVVWIYLPFFSRLNLTTAYEYLELRFNRAVRMLASAAFILFQAGRMAVVLYLPAMALAATTGLDVYTAILLMGVATTIYVELGGIEAVIWNDVAQVVVLLGGALLALALIVTEAGGTGEVLQTAAAADKFHMFEWSFDLTTTAVGVVVVGGLFTNLIPYTSDQSVVQRYLTTRDEQAAARSIWINAGLTIPATLIFFSIGTALFVFYRRRPELLDPLLPGDAVFPWFISQRMPPGVVGLVIMGIFAAAMSTLSSSVNSAVTAIVTDFVRPLRGSLSERSGVRLARALSVFLGLLGTGGAMALARYDVRSLWDVFLMVLGLAGSAQAGLFTLGIFSRRAHGRGALVGAAVAVAAVYFISAHTRLHFFLYAPVGILTCVGVGWLASCLLPGGPKRRAGLTFRELGAVRN